MKYNVTAVRKAGFTIVEMIVSLAVFSIVVTITVGSLLVLVASNQQLQAERSVMTNLSFVLDSMTREIRTGTRYFCVWGGNTNATFGPSNSTKVFADSTQPNSDLDDIAGYTEDCPNGREGNRLQGVAFRESGSSITGSAADYILYFFNEDEQQIYRKVGDEDPQPLISSSIIIEDVQFFVTGSAPRSDSGTELVQPTVTILIKAKDNDPAAVETYLVQTTVTQRELDL